MAAQYVLYDVGVIPRSNATQLFVLGRYGNGPPSAPSAILGFLAARRHLLGWSVCAFGSTEAACGLSAALLGGDVRMGFEDNFHLPGGRIAPGNAALVKHFMGVAGGLGFPTLPCRGARPRLGASLK